MLASYQRASTLDGGLVQILNDQHHYALRYRASARVQIARCLYIPWWRSRDRDWRSDIMPHGRPGHRSS
jgi:hypothetical protein